jgi:hypothetical protein
MFPKLPATVFRFGVFLIMGSLLVNVANVANVALFCIVRTSVWNELKFTF